MNLLNKLSNMNKSVANAGKVKMTPDQIKQCKAALIRDNRGYNVAPNQWDIAVPYRVAINYNNEWNNFGNFASADVAAAVGAIVSAGFFGDKAKVGEFDAAKVEASDEFKTWLADPRNASIIAQANGEATPVHTAKAAQVVDDNQPF